jgi:RNA polymerase subunit RPABC4/transcription elongation factor Spt4
MRCANCGAESQSADLTLCPVCGARFTRRWRREIRCPECGHFVAAALQVCPFCGATRETKPSNWGLVLLTVLAIAALAYSVQRYDLGMSDFAALKRAPSAAISRLVEWRDRLFSVEPEEITLPTPVFTRIP